MNRYYQQSPVVQGIGQFFAGWGQGRRESQLAEAQMQAQANQQQQASTDRMFGMIAGAGTQAGLGALGGAIGGPIGEGIAGMRFSDNGGGALGDTATLAGHISSIFGGNGNGGGTAAPSMPTSNGPPQMNGEVMGIPSAEFSQVFGGNAPMQGAQTGTPPSAIDPSQIPQYREAQQELMQLDAVAREVVTSARPIGEKNAILGSVAPRIQQLRTMVNSYPTPQPPRTEADMVDQGMFIPASDGGGYLQTEPGRWQKVQASSKPPANEVPNPQSPQEAQMYVQNRYARLPNGKDVLIQPDGKLTEMRDDNDGDEVGFDKDIFEEAVNLAAKASAVENGPKFNRDLINTTFAELSASKQSARLAAQRPEFLGDAAKLIAAVESGRVPNARAALQAALADMDQIFPDGMGENDDVRDARRRLSDLLSRTQ